MGHSLQELSLKCFLFVCFASIISKVKEHEEFFPAFYSLVMELLQTLGICFYRYCGSEGFTVCLLNQSVVQVIL